LSELARRVTADVEDLSDPARAADHLRYFKEEIETYGLEMPDIKDIAARYYKELKGDLPGAMDLTEELMRTRNLTLSEVGIHMLRRFKRHIKGTHFPRFDGWVDFLTNWANTDNLCCGLIALAVKDDPSHVESLVNWTGSGNRWRRRAAAVSLVPLVRKGDLFEDSIRVAARLMTDGDDMVRKGVGWMLKEASKVHPQEIHDYLVKWKPDTPALILRYASEKLPKELKVYKSR
jgi:3-methyladenine DNA glycosylase AlkD